MDVLLHSILPFLGVMIALVVWHELGHFLTAKAAGVKVLEFGVGYPPRAWGKKFGDTEYTINWLPLGGFVRMLGEEDPSDPRSLAAKPAWVRIVILTSGALMNVILPVLLFAAWFMIPHDVEVSRVRVDKVNPGSPAAQAGVLTGDQIVAVNGRKVENRGDAQYLITLNQGKTMTWDVRRPIFTGGAGSAGTENLTLQVYARWAPPKDPVSGLRQGPTGISLLQLGGQTERRSDAPWVAVPKGFRYTAESLVLARNQIVSLVKQKTAPPVSGPVGIADQTQDVVQDYGWNALLQWAALLSLNLAILNLLPLPMLDGGRTLFVLIELLRGGKRVPPEKEALVHLAGFALLMGLVVVVTFFDIRRIVT